MNLYGNKHFYINELMKVEIATNFKLCIEQELLYKILM
ncbi:hypothetical protein CLCAR_0384 [Clostridium carboxidivorans P7]|nr:hypothetical protein CLCAR_0384 [Clostridium carboxidivorans P7]